MKRERFSVSGPTLENRAAQSELAAVNVAQTFALRYEREATFYVRDGEIVIYHVVRQSDGVVVTYRKGT